MDDVVNTEADLEAAPIAVLVDKKIGDKEYFEHIKKVNDTFYDQIKAADQKAAYIFTFLIAFMISSAEGRGVFRFSQYMDQNVVKVIASGLLAVALVSAMISAIMAVLPRVRTTSTSLFWGTWPMHIEKVRDAHSRMDQDYLFNEYLDNATNLSLIARSKYKFVGYAFRSLAMAIMAYVLLLVSGAG